MCDRFTPPRRNRRELAQLLGVDEDDLRDLMLVLTAILTSSELFLDH